MTSRARIVVTGLVQGIGYRYFAHTHGRMLGLSGFARNLIDGSVEIEAQGERSQIERFVGELRAGPSGAVVSDVSVDWIATEPGSQGFAIL